MSKQKPIEWHANRLEAMIWLRENFPLLFSSEIKLLKVGIRQDIIATNKKDMPKEKWINCAIRHYVHNYSYLKLMKQGALRFNLEGMPENEISEEDAARAKEVLNTQKKQVAVNARQIRSERRVLQEKTKKEPAMISPVV